MILNTRAKPYIAAYIRNSAAYASAWNINNDAREMELYANKAAHYIASEMKDLYPHRGGAFIALGAHDIAAAIIEEACKN